MDANNRDDFLVQILNDQVRLDAMNQALTLHEMNCYFEELPDELIIKILAYLSPYSDTRVAKCVNRKWLRLVTAIEHQNHRTFTKAIKTHNIVWKINKVRRYDITDVLSPGSMEKPFRKRIKRPNANVPGPRFSMSSVIHGQFMYVFGGASSEHHSGTTYNDLYKLDLSTHRWTKIKAEGLLPAPRECCTFVSYRTISTSSSSLSSTSSSKSSSSSSPSKRSSASSSFNNNNKTSTLLPPSYKSKLILFAGVCRPPLERMHAISPRFFDDTQVFDIDTCTWERIPRANEPYPAARAAHSASVVGSKMLMFGGSQRSSRLNDVWELDLDTMKWISPYVRGKKPMERFGQSQFTISEDRVAILGGCGTPNEEFNDMWLLDTNLMSWTSVRIENMCCAPPMLWCHEPAMVDGDIVFFSDEKTCPHCGNHIERFSVPTEQPKDDAEDCTCGRKMSDRRVTGSFQPTTIHLQMYVLDCSKLLTTYTCEWLDYNYLTPAPLARRFFSTCVGKDEIYIFGGVEENSDHKVNDSCIVVAAKPALLQ